MLPSPVITESHHHPPSCSSWILQYCTCESTGDLINVICRGYDIVNISQQLPENTALFQYTAMELVVKLCSADFSHLMHLKTLAVQDPGDYHKIVERNIYPLENCTLMLGNRTKLQELRININWHTAETKLPDLFKGMKNIKVIDLSNTRWLDIDNLIESLQALRNYTDMKVLDLWNIKTMQHSAPNLNFELGKVLEPLSGSKLEVLNIGYNSFRSIDPGIIQFAPSLKKLIVRNNVLIPILTSSIMTEVLLHRSLEEADFSEQGFRPVNDNPIDLMTNNVQSSLIEPSTSFGEPEIHGLTHSTAGIPSLIDRKWSDAEDLENETLYITNERLEEILESNLGKGISYIRSLVDVLKLINTADVSSENNVLTEESRRFLDNPKALPDFLKKYIKCLILVYNDTCDIFNPECNEVKQILIEDHRLLCAALNFFFLWHFTDVHCDYIPPFEQMIRRDCGACLVVPSTGNIRKFLYTDLNVYDYVLQYGTHRDRPLCFHPNTSIEWIDMSGNSQHGYPELKRYFNAEITGLENIKMINTSRNSLDNIYNNISLNFPKLQVANLSRNLLTLEQGGAFIGFAKFIEVLDLSHNQIKELAVDKFSALAELQYLDLSHNLIEEFNVTLSGSKRLEYLDISNNRLQSITKFTIDQLNEIAMTNRSHNISVNIQSNNLICTCATKDFVGWILNRHPPNLIFVDGNTYICTNRYSHRVELHTVTMQKLNIECYETIIYGCVGAASIVFLLLIVLAYRRRFYLRHMWYKMNKRINKRTYNQRSHEYDAFICFDKADSDWIDFEAKRHLSHFNIAYGEQDIEPGQHIHQAVYEYIEKSYRSILVLSPNFVNSPNSLYHMSIVEEKLKFTGNDILIVVRLKPLNRVGLDRTLKELMEHRLCLEWKDDNQDSQDFFWERLVDALQAPCEELYDTPHDRTGLIQ